MDRRVRRTTKSISSAFIQLLKTYSIEEITIQQIADEADINRATFYKYYTDKYHLLTALEDNEIQNIKKHINYNALSTFRERNEKSLNDLFNGVPQNIVEIILKNIELYEVLFNMKRRSAIEDKLSDTIAQNLTTILNNEKNINTIPYRYFHCFIAGAIISTIKFWVLDPDRISKEALINSLYLLMYKGPLGQLLDEVSSGNLK
ncbi:TetR family regulatory protein [Staphylococcus piscifermentans]|uniref:TetR family transcriptional regulator n=1 Tax=Staphylococcus piscifermentans TaxID=70258 RepID=A0A239UEL9_9STAP|nr:TetR/AcrR family transcriptional regulator C-terminal domain-containing protein [Staphylococcus piscifermentans]RTX84880.1 TetR/AcrR family transcriptional regulator [Staphylococcus piscifermentans]GEP83815.1 TetR family transcriptional regulator [Staphylococcus piscifermentans]SNV08099.1 TetR family regulatory protein [Staphylococcus piscifermentans]